MTNSTVLEEVHGSHTRPLPRSGLGGLSGGRQVRHFRPVAASVPAARRFATDQIDSPEDAWLVGLLVSELATNAVEHAHTDFEVRLEVRLDDDGQRVRVEVTDGVARRPLLRRPRADAPGGRGMVIVDELARRWGVEPTGGGKVVWFEVPLHEPRSPGRARGGRRRR